jgi:type II secretory pathway pseudopilin PulG
MKQSMAILMSVIAIFAVVAVIYVANPAAFQAKTPEQQEQDQTQQEAAQTDILCGDDGKGELRLAATNPLNTSAKEYLAVTARMYTPGGSYNGDITTSASGLPAEGSGTACSFCGQDYAFYVAASDGSHTSTTGSINCADGESEVFELPQQAGLIFKVRDEENDGYVYASAETTAGGEKASGTSFYSTTSNSTGYAIGTDESFDYTLWTRINKTAAIDTQFTDKSLLIAENADDLSDWDEPAVSVDGADIDTVDCPTKISNDGYDYCYEVTDGNEPMVVAGEWVRINIQQQALDGVNPSDDITVGLFTSGYFVKTLSEEMGLGYTKDNPAKSYVYTGQTATFVFT